MEQSDLNRFELNIKNTNNFDKKWFLVVIRQPLPRFLSNGCQKIFFNLYFVIDIYN